MWLKLFDVRLFQSETLLLVNDLQQETEQEGGYTKGSQHDEGSGVVKFRWVCNTRVGGIEYFADEQRE